MTIGEDERAYLSRLGLDAEPPSAAALDRLHRAQVERVPYETVWIHEGRRWTTDPVGAARRIAHEGRGGYCYHLNGAFGRLLAKLGYEVTRHVGGVHGPEGPATDRMANHLVLIVHGLPAEATPDGRWYVDAGLGDGLHGPIPLAPGSSSHPPMTLTLAARDGSDGNGDWHLAHDPTGSFTGMSFRNAPATAEAFDATNEYLSTSPDSGFVRVCTVQRRRPEGGVDILRGRVFRDADAVETTFGDDEATAWFDLVAELGVRVPPDSRPALWARVSAAHAEHQRARAGDA